MLMYLFALGIILNIGFVAFADDATLSGLAGQGYGLPCQKGTACDVSITKYYEILLLEVRPEDIIMSTNLWVTRYYMGRLDGFLKEQKDGMGNFFPYQEATTDEYYGIQLIDTRDEVDDLLNEQKRVWVILDPRTKWVMSQEMRNTLVGGLQESYTNGFITTYINCFEPDCEERSITNE